MFYNSIKRYADLIVCTDSFGNNTTYTELLLRVGDIESLLPDKKTLFSIVMTPSVDAIAGYLALLRKGHTVLLHDESEKMHEVAKSYGVAYIWQPVERLEGSTFYRYHLIETGVPSPKLYQDLALLLSTSGSTGSSKLVRLSYDNLQANCDAIVTYLGLESRQKTITTLPFHYSFGLSILNTYLAVGGSIVLTDEPLMSKGFWELFKKESVTSLSGVPYHYEMLARVGFLKMELPSLKTMTQAGGKLNKKYVDLFAGYCKNHNVSFYVMYGQTEATARISYLPPVELEAMGDTIGRAIPGGLLYLLDDDGKEIDTFGKTGELVYEGPNVMLGYALTSRDLAHDDQMHGVLHTGDMAECVKPGYFRITGRKKRFLKIFGNRISLDELEHKLKAADFDVVLGGEDNLLIVAHLENCDVKRLKEAILAFSGVHHSAVKMLEVAAFPVTESGKIEYARLPELLKGKHFGTE